MRSEPDPVTQPERVFVSQKREADLAECIDKILKDYPKDFVVDDLFETDQIRIRKRGPARENFKAEEVIGLYLDRDFEGGKINENTIRNDIQRWLQLHGKKI